MYAKPNGLLIPNLMVFYDNIEADCTYQRYGPLTDRRFIVYCTYHGTYMDYSAEQALAKSTYNTLLLLLSLLFS